MPIEKIHWYEISMRLINENEDTFEFTGNSKIGMDLEEAIEEVRRKACIDEGESGYVVDEILSIEEKTAEHLRIFEEEPEKPVLPPKPIEKGIKPKVKTLKPVKPVKLSLWQKVSRSIKSIPTKIKRLLRRGE
jgi:hypothetical protein